MSSPVGWRRLPCYVGWRWLPWLCYAVPLGFNPKIRTPGPEEASQARSPNVTSLILVARVKGVHDLDGYDGVCR